MVKKKKKKITKTFKIVVLRQQYSLACARQQQHREDVYNLKMTLTSIPQAEQIHSSLIQLRRAKGWINLFFPKGSETHFGGQEVPWDSEEMFFLLFLFCSPF